MVLAKRFNQLVELLREVEEHNRMSLRELQIQHMLIPPLIRAVHLKREPNLFFSELLLLVLLALLLVNHVVAPRLPAHRSRHVYALYTVFLI